MKNKFKIKCSLCGIEKNVSYKTFYAFYNYSKHKCCKSCTSKIAYRNNQNFGFRNGNIVSKETREKISKSSIGKIGKNRGIKLSEEHKNKIRLSHLKEKSYRWITDRTKLKKSERKDKDVQYIEWRTEVKIRDNYKCRLLNSDCRGRLESHHIFNWIDYPELRYVINNGITLCAFHHPRGRGEEKRMIPIFQELLSVSEV